MANYATTFAFSLLNLSNEESAWLDYQCLDGNTELAWNIDPDGEGRDWVDFLLIISTETPEMFAARQRYDKDGEPYGTFASFNCDDTGSETQLASLLHAFLKAFPQRPPLGFGFSYTCDHDHWDAFGGGAVYITAARIEFMRGYEWLHAKLAGTAPS